MGDQDKCFLRLAGHPQLLNSNSVQLDCLEMTNKKFQAKYSCVDQHELQQISMELLTACEKWRSCHKKKGTKEWTLNLLKAGQPTHDDDDNDDGPCQPTNSFLLEKVSPSSSIDPPTCFDPR